MRYVLTVTSTLIVLFWAVPISHSDDELEV